MRRECVYTAISRGMLRVSIKTPPSLPLNSRRVPYVEMSAMHTCTTSIQRYTAAPGRHILICGVLSTSRHTLVNVCVCDVLVSERKNGNAIVVFGYMESISIDVWINVKCGSLIGPNLGGAIGLYTYGQ